jgi:hypothetical protein
MTTIRVSGLQEYLQKNNPIYAETKRKSLNINSSNVNAFIIIPVIVHSIMDKLHPENFWALMLF